MDASTAGRRDAGAPARSSGGSRQGWWLAGILAGLVTFVVQMGTPPASDVSWLLTVGERYLSGARLYVDAYEVNPPASVLLYVPAVLASDALGVRPESALVVLLIALVAGTAAFAGRILEHCRHAPGAPDLLVAAVLAFLLMPQENFAQREHVAVALMLPILALAAVRMDGRTASAVVALAAGLLAGMAVCIKPHFALAILLPQAASVLRRRSLGPLFGVENWATLAVVTTYAAVVVVRYPEFTGQVLPLALEVYRPVREDLVFTLIAPSLLLGALALYLLARFRALQPLLLVCVLASVGFALGFVEQGKAWKYHLYPAAAVAVFGVAADFLHRLRSVAASGGPRWPVYRTLPPLLVLLGLAFSMFDMLEPPSLRLADSVPADIRRPQVIALTADVGLGFPFVREIDGVWVGTGHSQWISSLASERVYGEPDLPSEVRTRMWAAMRFDRDMLIRDLRRARPDIVLVDTRPALSPDGVTIVGWREWALGIPELRPLVTEYQVVARNGFAELTIRKDLLR